MFGDIRMRLSEKDKVVQLRQAELTLKEANADLQTQCEEAGKRATALRQDNEALQQQKAAADDACKRERHEIRELKQR